MKCTTGRHCTEPRAGWLTFRNPSMIRRWAELPATRQPQPRAQGAAMQRAAPAGARLGDLPNSQAARGQQAVFLGWAAPCAVPCSFDVCALHDYRRSNQSAPRNLSNSRVPRKGLQQLERWWLSSMGSLASRWSLARTAAWALAPLFGSLLSRWHQQMNSWILLALALESNQRWAKSCSQKSFCSLFFFNVNLKKIRKKKKNQPLLVSCNGGGKWQRSAAAGAWGKMAARQQSRVLPPSAEGHRGGIGAGPGTAAGITRRFVCVV